MAFSGSSYVAGIGTAFAAIVFGFACGTMITTRAVQPPNRLERLNAGATDPAKPEPSSTTASSTEQSSPTRSSAQDGPTSAIAAAPAADPTRPSQPAAPAAAKADAVTRVQEQSPSAPAAASPTSPPMAMSEDKAREKNEGADVRSVDSNREAARKKAEARRSSGERKFSERRRRHDQQERQPDEATNVARQMPPESTVGAVVERDDAPRYRARPRPFALFGDDDSPRVINQPPPRFGFFGD